MSDFFDIPQKDSLPKEQIEQLQKQKKELKFIGNQRAIPGLTLFSYNLETGEIKVAEMVTEAALDYKTRQLIYKKKLVIERFCVYRQALNKKNFIKKLIREGFIVK